MSSRHVAGQPRRPRTGRAVQVVVGFVALLYLVEIADVVLGHRLDGAGILPRDPDGLDGIVFAPLLHGGWAHLVANTAPLLLLGFLLLLSGLRRAVAVTLVVWVVGGVGTWLTGGDGSVHLGASGLVFGWLVYLLLRGLWSRSLGQILLGVALFVAYGGVLWGVLPGAPGISWQGHLFGALGGALAARSLGRRDRTRRRGAPTTSPATGPATAGPAPTPGSAGR